MLCVMCLWTGVSSKLTVLWKASEFSVRPGSSVLHASFSHSIS